MCIRDRVHTVPWGRRRRGLVVENAFVWVVRRTVPSPAEGRPTTRGWSADVRRRRLALVRVEVATMPVWVVKALAVGPGVAVSVVVVAPTLAAAPAPAPTAAGAAA